MMSATQQLTITLPSDLVERVHSLVSKGEFESESEAIESALLSTILFEPPSPADLDRWVKTEGARRCEEQDANPSQAMSHEQIWKFLDEDEELDEQQTAA